MNIQTTKYQNNRQISIIWHVEDIKEIRPDLTDQQCVDVLQVLERHHDACIGINWDVICCVCDDLFPKQVSV